MIGAWKCPLSTQTSRKLWLVWGHSPSLPPSCSAKFKLQFRFLSQDGTNSPPSLNFSTKKGQRIYTCNIYICFHAPSNPSGLYELFMVKSSPLSQASISTRRVKCWGLLRTAALESGVEVSTAIRTQILRTCLLQAPDMSCMKSYETAMAPTPNAGKNQLGSGSLCLLTPQGGSAPSARTHTFSRAPNT